MNCKPLEQRRRGTVRIQLVRLQAEADPFDQIVRIERLGNDCIGSECRIVSRTIGSSSTSKIRAMNTQESLQPKGGVSGIEATTDLLSRDSSTDVLFEKHCKCGDAMVATEHWRPPGPRGFESVTAASPSRVERE
jgi:hypothetical protein